MNLDILIYVVIALVIGVGIGNEIMRRHFYSKIIGNLRVDQSIEDDDPYLFLEITKGNVDKFRNEKYVVLQVLNENYIPHD